MPAERPPRTVLEQLIRQRGHTAEEVSQAAETFAREHGIRATLSPRHVQRLAAGQRADGRDLGPLRAPTRRLVEAMFGHPIDELLAAPPDHNPHHQAARDDPAAELRARLDLSRSIDPAMVSVFQQKLELARVVDRQLGAAGLLGELTELIGQIEHALCYCLNPRTRTALAQILVDCSTLAGWQSLDHGLFLESWRHYDRARTAARAAASPALEAYSCAAQAVVLLDIGRAHDARQLTEHARTLAAAGVPSLLDAWLAAALGETCAANGDRTASLRAFDEAAQRMPATPDRSATPYIVFGPTHLSRWRGNALARLGDIEAIDVLSEALRELDPTFTRAEAALRVDLALALTAAGEAEAAAMHAHRARQLALQVGSVRNRARLDALGR